MELFLNGRVRLISGDCREALKELPDNSVDSGVMDPPYALVSIGKRFGADDAAPAKVGATGAYARASAGFMGKKWDTGETAFAMEFWAEVLRVLKPGAHLAAFSGTRTYHRMACAIEDAGFEIRDQIGWVYGQGFPKSHDVKKGSGSAICRCAASDHQLRSLQQTKNNAGSLGKEGEEPNVLPAMQRQIEGAGSNPSSFKHEGKKKSAAIRREKPSLERRSNSAAAPGQLCVGEIRSVPTASDSYGSEGRLHNGASQGDGGLDGSLSDQNGNGTPQGSRPTEQLSGESGVVADERGPQEGGIWPICGRCCKPIIPDGLGTALKPAWEPICLARKPLSEKTVAANVLRWGTGAINVDGCRVGDGVLRSTGNGKRDRQDGYGMQGGVIGGSELGRFPANLIHDGSDEVLAGFPEGGPSKSVTGSRSGKKTGVLGAFVGQENITMGHDDNGGSSARFFYTAKADGDDRLGSKHPTVKPVDLMQWLCRLITPPGGVVLDCFAGTGTTGEAAWREGFTAILMEREVEYQGDIRKRMGIANQHSAARKIARAKIITEKDPDDFFNI